MGYKAVSCGTYALPCKPRVNFQAKALNTVGDAIPVDHVKRFDGLIAPRWPLAPFVAVVVVKRLGSF